MSFFEDVCDLLNIGLGGTPDMCCATCQHCYQTSEIVGNRARLVARCDLGTTLGSVNTNGALYDSYNTELNNGIICQNEACYQKRVTGQLKYDY